MEVDPGMIRRARLEAGLSMAQLAGSDMSRQAIFLIETGKTRPSMYTLEIIAGRTGKPVSHFTNGLGGETAAATPTTDPRVDQLQAFCLQHQFEAAIALGQQVLAGSPVPAVEAHVRQYVGQAMVRLSRPEEGLEHLRRAQSLLDPEQDPWLAVECADWEACALYLKEDSRALSVAEHALKLCRATSPRIPGTEARILEHIASIHVKNHTFDQAVAFYEEALKVAGAVRDLSRLGRTYHGLSIAYQERGELGRAIEFTHKALALYALEHDNVLLARGENELGLLLMKQGHLARAEEAFRGALEHFDKTSTESAKSHVLLSLAELQLKSGRRNESVATVQQAIDLARRLGERLAESSGHRLLGQLYERMGKRRLADQQFVKAIRLLRGEEWKARLAETHAAYAEVLEARRGSNGASRHWKLAAQLSLPARERSPRAARAR